MAFDGAPQTTYRAQRHSHGCTVLVDRGAGLAPLNPRLDLANHSPEGFEWGYAGSGPAQLALALLADALLDDARAVRLHQRFKFRFISSIPREATQWTYAASEIRRLCDVLENERDEQRSA